VARVDIDADRFNEAVAHRPRVCVIFGEREASIESLVARCAAARSAQ
jgi:hypothetical protein